MVTPHPHPTPDPQLDRRERAAGALADAAADPPGQRFVSTGSLPGDTEVAELVNRAQQEFRQVAEGRLSEVYPALAQSSPDLFGLAMVGSDGGVFEAGDARTAFTIMSVSKPFVFALVSESVGIAAVRHRVGVNATGLPFNSIQAVERTATGRTNPMVNAGAIATTSLVPGATDADRWEFISDGLARFAGHPLQLSTGTLESARATNFRNRSLGILLGGLDALVGDPLAAVDLYTEQCCLEVTALDLAVMGATLADGGVNPVTGERVVSAAVARATLAVMGIAGMYESSGDWLLDVGVPGKSGISGGLVAVSPGKGALGSFSPLLDAAGNSVRGQLAARYLAGGLGLDILGSAPRPAP